jgi:hypothetical protein
MFRIPGTNRRIGLDPFIGLIPGVGDAISAGLGSLILLQAMREGVPQMLLFRMAGNVFINGAVGVIPIAGDLFSVWFQSNNRNYELLQKWHLEGRPMKGGGHGRWLAGGCVLMLAITAGICFLLYWIIAALWRWIAN